MLVTFRTPVSPVASRKSMYVVAVICMSSFLPLCLPGVIDPQA
jgi:hypothetical protein